MLNLVSESGTRKKWYQTTLHTYHILVGISFLVPESGTGFWYVCHGHYIRIFHCRQYCNLYIGYVVPRCSVV